MSFKDDPSREEYIRAHTIGEMKPLTAGVVLVEYDPRWPEMFRREERRIRQALGQRAIRIEHAGSTSVPGLIAKPIIDIILEVADSSEESAYVPHLEAVGYVLRIREPEWFQHRMFKGPDFEVNLHVYTAGCDEVEKMLKFRDWLRSDPADRELYARTKRDLSQRGWKYIQEYADAKTDVVADIMTRAIAAKSV
jgi:GrpB-like predicted nucleotidyltransferase (UPF0157 family)